VKIAYFDYWTEGIQNFKLIDEKLRELGHETLLLHIGSFNAPQEKEQVVSGIKCNDISSYDTRFIFNMLAKEKPDVVLTLNTTSILDRVVALSCKNLGIKSFYVMHGNRNYGDSQDYVISLFEKSYNSFIKKIKRIPKYASIVIPNYIFTLYKCNPRNLFNLRFIRVVYSYFRNPGKSLFFPEYPDEILQDKCLVYSNNESEYYQRLNYSPANIHVVGNPKLDSLHDMIVNLKFTPDMLPERVMVLVLKKQKYALFLEEALPEQNEMGGYTCSVREQMLLDIAERLVSENMTLVVKLHPGTNPESVKVQHDNMIIERECLDSLICFSDFCITNASTTINNCVLMGKPVVAPRWSAAKNLTTLFTDLGVSNFWHSVNDKLDLSINAEARKKYVELFITVTKPEAVNNIVSYLLCQ